MIKTIIAAAAIAVMPMTAFAVSTNGSLTEGATVQINQNGFNETFSAVFENDAEGSFSFFLENPNAGGSWLTVAFNNVLQTISGVNNALFTNTFSNITGETYAVKFEFVNSGDFFTVATGESVSDVFLSTYISGGETEEFRVTYGAATKSPQLDFVLQAVPLPAGALLLGTALVGLGFARRRVA